MGGLIRLLNGLKNGLRYMTNKETIIRNLKIAIELAGDGGIAPFTNEEERDMYEFLDSLLDDKCK